MVNVKGSGALWYSKPFPEIIKAFYVQLTLLNPSIRKPSCLKHAAIIVRCRLRFWMLYNVLPETKHL